MVLFILERSINSYLKSRHTRKKEETEKNKTSPSTRTPEAAAIKER